MTSNKSHEKAVQEIPQHGFFGHPKGLGVLFFRRILGDSAITE